MILHYGWLCEAGRNPNPGLRQQEWRSVTLGPGATPCTWIHLQPMALCPPLTSTLPGPITHSHSEARLWGHFREAWEWTDITSYPIRTKEVQKGHVISMGIFHLSPQLLYLSTSLPLCNLTRNIWSCWNLIKKHCKQWCYILSNHLCFLRLWHIFWKTLHLNYTNQTYTHRTSL